MAARSFVVRDASRTYPIFVSGADDWVYAGERSCASWLIVLINVLECDLGRCGLRAFVRSRWRRAAAAYYWFLKASHSMIMESTSSTGSVIVESLSALPRKQPHPDYQHVEAAHWLGFIGLSSVHGLRVPKQRGRSAPRIQLWIRNIHNYRHRC